MYGAELEADAAEGVLTALRVAFSRQHAACKVWGEIDEWIVQGVEEYQNVV